MLIVGACQWATCGQHIGNAPGIASKFITAGLAGIILVLKLTAEPTDEPTAP